MTVLQTESVCIDRLAPDELREYATYLRETLARVTGADDNRVPGLSPAESRIVRALEAAQGRTLNTSALMDAIYWDRPADTEEPMPKIIQVWVCKIRKKRPDIGTRIKAAWGQGYRLEPQEASA